MSVGCRLRREVRRDAAVGVAVGDEVEALEAIAGAGVAAAIWCRRAPPEAQEWLDALDPDVLPTMRQVLRPDEAREALEVACDRAGTPESTARDSLLDDMAGLAEHFTRLACVEHVRLRLGVQRGDGCTRFHLDAVTERLICTYRGPGTQYGVSTDGGLPARVFSVPTGAPVVLRGSLCPRRPAPGLLHRSPPIMGTGAVRLVLVLNPVADPEDTA